MTERKIVRRLPAASGYCTVAQWNIDHIEAIWQSSHGYITVKIGNVGPNRYPDAEISLTPAGWRALTAAVNQVAPQLLSEQPTADEMLFAANIIERLHNFPALNNRRGEWSADMLRRESKFFPGGTHHTDADSDADYPAAEVTA